MCTRSQHTLQLNSRPSLDRNSAIIPLYGISGGCILPNNTIDGSKCISYLTIELKDSIPASFMGMLDDWMFGCDICQDVCPWNRFSKSHSEPLFNPNPKLLSNTKQDWEEITHEVFSEIFRKSAVKRTKFTGLQRNIRALKRDA